MISSFLVLPCSYGIPGSGGGVPFLAVRGGYGISGFHRLPRQSLVVRLVVVLPVLPPASARIGGVLRPSVPGASVPGYAVVPWLSYR